MTLHLFWPDNETPPCRNASPLFLPRAEAGMRVAPSAADRGSPHRYSGVEDPGMAALHKDLLRASALICHLEAASARLVDDHPQIVLDFNDVASARMCFALIWPE